MSDDQSAIALATRILDILDQGSFSATYKYALFIAVLDLTISKNTKGALPTTLTTRELAERLIEVYWPHASPFNTGTVPRQGGVRSGSQAEIVEAIVRFRAEGAGSPADLRHRARLARPESFKKLVRFVEWKLIEMPIPRLQVLGREEDRFLYEYNWSKEIRRGEVSAYLQDLPSQFDNRLLLKPGVAESLVRLNSLLRPLIQREWAVMVASMNDQPEAKLEAFLFDQSRVSLEPVRRPLHALQSGRCFYCGRLIDGQVHVDHFLPWAHYHDNSLDNLVAAHPQCNAKKSDHLATVIHVEQWRDRAKKLGEPLGKISADLMWEHGADRSRGVALTIYGYLSPSARLWRSGDSFEPADKKRLLELLSA